MMPCGMLMFFALLSDFYVKIVINVIEKIIVIFVFGSKDKIYCSEGKVFGLVY